MKRIITITFYTIYFLLISKSFSQSHDLGKVTIDELKQQYNPIDSSAAAAYLFKIGEVRYYSENRYTFYTITKVKTKIKIYKTKGLDFANNFIRYYTGYRSYIKIELTNSATYNLLDGNKIEKTVLKDDGQFTATINDFYKLKEITMPNVKVGSILEFEYTVTEKGVGTPLAWNFQQKVPIHYSEFVTIIPDYFKFKKNFKGFIFPKMETSKVLDKSEYEEQKTTYITNNLPAIKEENYINNIDNYISSVVHEFAAFNNREYSYQEFTTGWDKVTNYVYKLIGFNEELKKTGYFENDINLLVKDISDRDEKIYSILQFVKSKVKWNNEYGITCRYGVKNAYKEGAGNIAEINLMLVAMLRYAGIEASPVLVSTRDNGIVLFPSVSAFNYLIAAVEIENDLILLDASNKYSTLNVLPLRDLNGNGRIIRKEGSTSAEVSLSPKNISRVAYNINYSVNEKMFFTGKIRTQFSNNEALKLRTEYDAFNNKNILDELEKKYVNVEIYDYSRSNDNNLNNPATENFSFKVNNNLEIVMGKLYFSPLLFLAPIENPFTEEKREYPVDFGYPIEKRYNINIEIPEGYAIETLPEVMNVDTEEKTLFFKFLITSEENKIQISITYINNTAELPADYYGVLKEFYKQMTAKLTEKIVLVKK